MASYQRETAEEAIQQVEWALQDMEEEIFELRRFNADLEQENEQLKKFIHELTGLEDFNRLSVGQVLEIRQKVTS